MAFPRFRGFERRAGFRATGGAVREPKLYHPRRRDGYRLTARDLRAYPAPPPSWAGPLNEWIVWDYLTRVKRLAPGRDFYYQAAVPAVGLYASGRDFSRTDFLIPTNVRGGVGAGWRAICLDPRNPFTHPDPAYDRLKRAVFAQEGYLLIFIDDHHLHQDPAWVLELALKGRDVSSVDG